MLAMARTNTRVRAALLRGSALVLAVLSLCALCSCGGRRKLVSTGAESFSVLMERAGVDDVIPPQVAEALGRDVSSESVPPDLGAARRVLPDSPVWLVPSPGDELCLAALNYPLVSSGAPALPPAPSLMCSTRSEALSGELVVTRSLATTVRMVNRRARVYGVVPDGVREVQIVFRHGKRAWSDVIRNGYEVVVDDPEDIEFRAPQAGRLITHVVRLTLPSFRNSAPASGEALSPGS